MNEKKIKVALLSFHNAYNYGAAMQAYGLQEAIQEMGVDAEYINYVNSHRQYIYDTLYQVKVAIREKKIIRALRLLAGSGFIYARGKKFKDFYDLHLKKTDKVYHNSSEASELNGLYDKYIVGSDQVWNCNNNGGDAAYLLDFVANSDQKISYASSFGMSDIPEKYISMYTNALKGIGRIAVREVAGSQIVEKYTNRKPHVVLDPVFLAGVQTWDKLKREGKVKDEKYFFFYTNRNSQIRDFWNIGFKRDGVKSHILSSFVGLKDFLNPYTSVRVAMTPADFLNEIASAELVVTASFHCVAFSIVFHKKFFVFLTGNRGKDERILNLLHICGLESRIITNEMTVEKIEQEIDYDEVDRRLQPYLDYSKEYLKHAIFSLPDIEQLDFPDGNSSFFCDDERCTGCMACVTVCPTNAIDIINDKEGFLVPRRNTSKCINCYTCNEVCQIYNPIKHSKYSQRYFAAKNTDEIRRKSSSGGIFSALSDKIISRGGVVCAAEMDECFNVKHVFATTTSDRNKMRKTLYVQSDISGVYKGIESYLNNNRPVLFVGTPCQVAGLYRGLSTIDISNLFTCDLVCHGVPSPGIFGAFIDYIKKEYGGLDEFNFRDKEMGWKHSYTVSAIANGKKIKNSLKIQSFSKMFSKNIINRSSCANCAYTNYDRIGDITFGDFWGIERANPEFSDKLGISLVVANTEKGQKWLESCDNMRMIEVKKEETKQNSLLKQAIPSENKMDAFRIYSQSGYETLARKYGEENITGVIKKIVRDIFM